MAEQAETEWVILKGDSETGPWTERGRVSVRVRARSVQAIQELVGGAPSEADTGWYLAVPADRYVPRYAGVRVETLLTFDAEPQPTPGIPAGGAPEEAA